MVGGTTIVIALHGDGVTDIRFTLILSCNKLDDLICDSGDDKNFYHGPRIRYVKSDLSVSKIIRSET